MRLKSAGEPSQRASQQRHFLTGGVSWTKFELSLSKPPTKEASPATARQARTTTEKYSLLFSFCARRIFSSLNEKSIFLWCFALTSKAAGLASIFCKNTAEFPPHPPSAVFLRGRTGFLAAALSNLCIYVVCFIKILHCTWVMQMDQIGADIS